MSFDLFNTGNIMFLVVYGILTLLVLAAVLIVFRIVFLITIKIFRKILPTKEIKRTAGADIEPVVKELQESQIERTQVENQQGVVPGQRMGYSNYSVQSKDKDQSQTKKDAVSTQKEKAQQDAEKGLAALKSKNPSGQGTLESKMPSRTTNNDGDNKRAVVIPVPKRLTTSGKEEQLTSNQKQNIGFEKTAFAASHGVLKPSGSMPGQEQEKMSQVSGGAKEHEQPQAQTENQATESSSRSILGQKINVAKSGGQHDASIFEGKEEVSKTKLKHEMRYDSKIWKAERSVGLTLNPGEREELVKEVFGPSYGRNISKSDLKQGIRKLNQKMMNSKDMAEKGKLRKEAAFLKKIGGIK
jgi:hypothetical protein